MNEAPKKSPPDINGRVSKNDSGQLQKRLLEIPAKYNLAALLHLIQGIKQEKDDPK